MKKLSIKRAELSAEPRRNDFEKTAVMVSVVSILGNAVLSLGKLLAGLIARSGAMVSDAAHSASDVFSSIIVIIGVRLSAKTADKEHPYGHERFECVAAIVLAVILCVTGLFIGYRAVEHVAAGDARAQAVLGERGIWHDDALWLPCLGAKSAGATLRSLFAKAVGDVFSGGREPQEALVQMSAIYEAITGK